MWRIDAKDLEYGPRTVDYIIIDGAVRAKHVHNTQKMAGLQVDRHSYKPEFPTYTMTWPIVTSSPVRHGGYGPLYTTLMELPLNKTVTFRDEASDFEGSIQILDRIKENIKTVNNGEILRSITLKIRFM